MANQVTEAEWRQACDNYMGWCTKCEDFTRDSTEPDARAYCCPVCDGNTVMGAEDAMMTRAISIQFDD